MQFLVDENIRREVFEHLASMGDSTYVPRGASDTSVAHIAQTERRILITHDKDFINALTYPPQQYYGIIILRIHPPQPTVINDALSHLFHHHDEKVVQGHLIILESDGFVISPSTDPAE